MFGLDKKKPSDYQGERKSDAIISGCMKAANSLVKDRKAGKKGSPTSKGGSTCNLCSLHDCIKTDRSMRKVKYSSITP